MSNLCISSLVVQAQPALLASVRNELEAMPDTEVMGHRGVAHSLPALYEEDPSAVIGTSAAN